MCQIGKNCNSPIICNTTVSFKSKLPSILNKRLVKNKVAVEPVGCGAKVLSITAMEYVYLEDFSVS